MKFFLVATDLLAAISAGTAHEQIPLKPQYCSGPVKSGRPNPFWLDQQDHNGSARGYAPFLAGYYTYPVYRNVLAYGAKNDGSGDQMPALQQAINDDGRNGNRYQANLTTEPAEVFIPSGIYQLQHTLDLRMGTIIVGDPTSPPILKASAGFIGDTIINGYDYATGHPETSFMTLLKNVIIDTTSVDKDRSLIALQWGVAQGCGLTNVKINMPTNSHGHIGISLDGGSTIAVTDVQITGGAIGIRNSNQQVNFKNIYFKFCTTAYSGGGFTTLLQGVTFDTCGIGAELGISAGSFILLDSASVSSGAVIKFNDPTSTPSNRNNQIVIQNLLHDNSNPIVVNSSFQTVLAATCKVDTWVWGNAYPGNPDSYQQGTSYITSRSPRVLSNGKFFTRSQPTYQEYASDQFVNVKAVSGFPVKGDGITDDSASLNAILQQNAADCKITYFPYGVYIVKETLLIPPGSRIVGEAWPVISGAGRKFKDSSNPVAVVKVGNFDDTGVAEVSEMRFTVSEVLPGAIIVEVNLAGAPGDVGFWNSLITIGGTADSSVTTTCQNQDTKNCMAAFMVMHLTSSSSAYIENLWGWTADHDVDSDGVNGDTTQNIATGRGLLVEATKGTWLVGTGFEHHWLYNYIFNNAQNVYGGLLQSETPYMQGMGALQTIPTPWVADSRYGDPDYSWCAGDNQRCRTALATNINGGSNIFLYNSAAWAFFNGPWKGDYSHQCDGNCQINMMRVTGNPTNLVWYGVNIKSADIVILDGISNPASDNNPGSWGGNLVAYRQFASSYSKGVLQTELWRTW